MKLYKEFDKSKAICNHCKAVVETVFLYRDVPFASGKGRVNDILVGVCTQCDSVVSTPAQSTPKIKEAIVRNAVSLEASLPAVYLEVLDTACMLISPISDYTKLRKTVIAHYIRDFSTGIRKKEVLTAILSSTNEMFKNNSLAKKKRLSMKVSAEFNEEIETLATELNLDKTKLIKSVVQLIQDEVVEKESPPEIKKIREIAHLVQV